MATIDQGLKKRNMTLRQESTSATRYQQRTKLNTGCGKITAMYKTKYRLWQDNSNIQNQKRLWQGNSNVQNQTQAAVK